MEPPEQTRSGGSLFFVMLEKKKMENKHIAPLIELASRFEGEEWRRAVDEAGRENEWFTPRQIEVAVRALRNDLLRPEQLWAWLDRYSLAEPTGRSVGIVMAGNLPLVGFADLAAAVAVGCRVWVKPSSKDRALMEYVVRALRQNGCEVELLDALPAGATGWDGVIATGSDATRDRFARQFVGLPVLLRGARQSVAVLNGAESDREVEGLSEDMFLYWGLGCRSVVRLFVPQGYDRTRLVARLAACDREVHPKYEACYRYARAMAAMGGERVVDGGFFLLRYLEMEAGPTVPKVGEVFWSEYRSEAEVVEWLERHESALQCAVGAVPEAFPRRVRLGETQHPGWTDYADGVDTVRFLLSL